MPTTTESSKLLPELVELGLERHVLDLEVDGLTVVPAAVHGVPQDELERLRSILLGEAGRQVGTRFDLDAGPADELEFPARGPSGIGDGQGETTQFLLYQLTRLDRGFRDLAINPVAVALMRHLLGPNALRFSSHNSFIKWQGEHGYGRSLGMHADQGATPRPWGVRARTSNTNWCLTDYTLEGGCFAYVPGSHRIDSQPRFPDAVEKAVPVEAPVGSLIVFHGGVWHGAFPRTIPGMRVSIANYYRHTMITSQEEFRNTFPPELIDDCADPTLFRALLGIDDQFPYSVGSGPLPRVRAEPRPRHAVGSGGMARS